VAEVRSSDRGRIALLHLNFGQPIVLEQAAAATWILIDGKRSQADIVDILDASYDDPENQMAEQVNGFLLKLASSELIEPTTDQKPG
jgi:hypothetical protein